MPRKKSFITLTDQFCGAGGSSIGATMAGAEVRLAMNHWKLAIDTHNTNFPHVDHDCTDISAVNPRRYPSTDILITSPECTNHSLAKGKPRRFYEKDLFNNVLIDPSEERSRATMWDVPRFAEYHDYRMIIVENVVDAAKWRMWDAWLSAMHALGYEHEVVYFNSMFAFPTPQSRDRLYTIFWKKGNRKPDLEFRPVAYCSHCEKNIESIQTWKKRAKWGRYRAQYFYRCPGCHQEVTPYYFAAFNAIDWTIEAERIGDRKTPLKPKTLARIQYGLEAYGRQIMVVTGRYTSGLECRVKDAYREALPTQPGDASHAVVMPWMVDTAHHGNGKYISSSAGPGPTQTSYQSLGIVAGFVTKNYGGGAQPQFMSSGLDEPTGALTTANNQSLISLSPGFLIRQNDIEHGSPKRRSIPFDNPLGTVLTQDTHALVGMPSFIAEMHGTLKAGRIDEPLMCITSNGSHHALLSAGSFLSYYYGTKQASGMAEPVHTMTGLDRAALIQALDSLTVEDLYFRMLQPQEIGKVMAFPGKYVVLGTKREKVKQYGNAVTPPAMEMLIERCIETFHSQRSRTAS
jgi:DNA (cytosine-5)-methyltransferase 1